MVHRIKTRIGEGLEKTETTYGLSSLTKRVILIAPFVLLFLSFLFLALPPTRQLAIWALDENRPVEILTFLALMWGGLLGASLALRFRRQGAFWLAVFYGLFSLGLLVVGLEEVAWGQSFFGFQTPQAIKEINAQEELTLHNIDGLQGHSEVFRLVFGAAGLIGIMMGYVPRFRKIGVPLVLLPWFLLITAHAAFDVFDDIVSLGAISTILMRQTSEMVELLIGGVGLLYIWLNLRMLLRKGDLMPKERTSS